LRLKVVKKRLSIQEELGGLMQLRLAKGSGAWAENYILNITCGFFRKSLFILLFYFETIY